MLRFAHSLVYCCLKAKKEVYLIKFVSGICFFGLVHLGLWLVSRFQMSSFKCDRRSLCTLKIEQAVGINSAKESIFGISRIAANNVAVVVVG